MNKKLLSIKDVCDKIGFSHTFVYNLIRLKKFPAQIIISNRSRWLESDVDTWIEQQIAT